MGKTEISGADFTQLAKLALQSTRDDVALFVRRIARRLQNGDTRLAAELEKIVQGPARGSILRDAVEFPPVDADSRLQLLRTETPTNLPLPVWSDAISESLQQIITEREHRDELEAVDLLPTRSVLFVGPPGVGKTLTARWLAGVLDLPLLTLDLSAVMSSFLGRTGGNLRNVMDYARSHRCVLLLDEFDAIAKRRDDATEVGELKRLVTVLLQEIDSWPAEGVLIAASNHPELLDPAVWRRFDLVVQFGLPDEAQIARVLREWLTGFDCKTELADAISPAFVGLSFSEIEREVKQAKRRALMKRIPLEISLGEYVQQRVSLLPKQEQIKMALDIVSAGASQHTAEKMTGVARATIRKHLEKIEEVA